MFFNLNTDVTFENNFALNNHFIMIYKNNFMQLNPYQRKTLHPSYDDIEKFFLMSMQSSKSAQIGGGECRNDIYSEKRKKNYQF